MTATNIKKYTKACNKIPIFVGHPSLFAILVPNIEPMIAYNTGLDTKKKISVPYKECFILMPLFIDLPIVIYVSIKNKKVIKSNPICVGHPVFSL